MSITNNISLAKARGQKNILLNHETVLIVGAILAAIILFTLFFSFLWAKFQVAFVCILAWILIVITRKTDSWKMGIECYYIFTFLLAYAFNVWLSLFVVVSGVLFVIKVFRPDELQGSLSQLFGIIGIGFSTKFFVARYGMSITKPQLLFAGLILFIIWDFIRFLAALKICPAHWVKLFASFITGIFVNYFYYSTFAFPLLMFLLSL